MTAGEAPARLPYTPALDGLRAIAVLAVMLYHGGVAVTSGGFLGVDIFFVLSGFLITTLLLLEFDATGGLNLTAFWGRRARRLLPALFLVLVAVLLYAAFLRGEAAASVRADTLATLFYVSNWWFIVSGNSYFDQFQDPSPLTHTWSLAIEEQWYLLLPLVLVLLLPRVRSRAAWAAVFASLALISAATMFVLHTPGADPSRVYYGTDTRLQALLAGAFLACILTPGAMERFRGWARWLAPLAMLAVVGVVVMASDRSEWLYSGGFLFVAIVSALLLASVVSHPGGVVARGLAWRPVVWVGRISYGLYLWHWPVYVVLNPARTGLSGPGLLVLRFAVTFAAAALSYYLVEMPVRRGALNRFTSGQRLSVVLAAPAVVLAVMGLSAAVSRPPATDSLEAIRDSVTRSPTPTPTTSESPGDDPIRAILVGDSVALSLFAAYQPGSTEGLTVLPGTEFGCGLVPFDAALNGTRMPVREECAKWDRERAPRIAASGANFAVMFPGPWEQYDRWIAGESVAYTDPRWHDATVRDYERVLREMAAVTDRVAVVLDTCHGAPELDLPDTVLFQAGRYPGVVNDQARVDAVNAAAQQAAAQSGLDVTVIDPNPYLCRRGYQGTIDGVQMHTDGVHFTESGARLYWKWLGPQVLKAARTPQATPSVPVR